MGVVTNPLIGRTREAVGNVVFTKWKGLLILKTKPHPRNPKTVKQTAHRIAFKLLLESIRTQTAWQDTMFHDYKLKAGGKTGNNASMHYNLGPNGSTLYWINGVVGGPPFVDFTKAIWAAGSILPVQAPILTNNTIAAFQLSWTDNTNGTTALATDNVWMIIVNTNTSTIGTKTFYDSIAIMQSDIRSAGVMTHGLPAIWSGRTVAVYTACKRDAIPLVAPQKSSDSLYVTTTTIP